MNEAKLTKDLRHKLWAEACNYATDLENALITPSQAQPSCTKIYNRRSQILDNLHQFVEMAVLERHEKRKMRGNWKIVANLVST